MDFVGRQIRELREAAGMTSAELAEAVGIGPSAMSLVESGRRQVKTDELMKIAEALTVSPLAILEEDSLLARLPVSFRADDREVSRGSVFRRLTALAELHQVLAEAGLPAQSMARPLLNTSGKGWHAQARLAAGWFQNVVRDDPRVSIPNHFENLATMIEIVLKVDILVESHPDDSTIGAAITEPEFPFLFVNANQPRSRSLFTLAHELGHLLLGHGNPIACDANLSSRNDDERAANAFAAQVLMPEQHVEKLVSEHDRSADALAEMLLVFEVSYESLIYRLHNLELINARGRDELKAAGWPGLLRSVTREDLRARLVALKTARTDALIPGWLASRAYAGFVKGCISIRPFAGLIGADPDELLAAHNSPNEPFGEDYSHLSSPRNEEALFEGDPVG